ncbi:hypothetical protein FBU59_000743 [Linderina macrospora]|uniref:Uncharacterized protein n=1 Tax=Linderina macrospora TaxID=4868 RepID=A0ACC1JG17_9FUNG|nr:hypothetical protein FBU59_000743 [Linderina macrospora]
MLESGAISETVLCNRAIEAMPKNDKNFLFMEFRNKALTWPALKRSISKLLSLDDNKQDQLLRAIERQLEQPFDRQSPTAELYRMRTMLDLADTLPVAEKRRYLVKRLPMDWRKATLQLLKEHRTFENFADALEEQVAETARAEYELGDLLTDKVPNKVTSGHTNIDAAMSEAAPEDDTEVAETTGTGNTVPRTRDTWMHSEPQRRPPAAFYLASDFEENANKEELIETVNDTKIQVPLRLLMGTSSVIRENMLKGNMRKRRERDPAEIVAELQHADKTKLRFIQDLQPLNQVTIRNAGKPPIGDEIAEDVSGRALLTTFDLKSKC